MGNLGWYQVITKASKCVGGPKVFLGLVAAGGYVSFRAVEASAKKAVAIVKKKVNKEDDECKDLIFVVVNEVTDEQGLTLHEGDQIRILASDEGAVLIEIIGAENNPYYVSEDFLTAAFTEVDLEEESADISDENKETI